MKVIQSRMGLAPSEMRVGRKIGPTRAAIRNDPATPSAPSDALEIDDERREPATGRAVPALHAGDEAVGAGVCLSGDRTHGGCGLAAGEVPRGDARRCPQRAETPSARRTTRIALVALGVGLAAHAAVSGRVGWLGPPPWWNSTEALEDTDQMAVDLRNAARSLATFGICVLAAVVGAWPRRRRPP